MYGDIFYLFVFLCSHFVYCLKKAKYDKLCMPMQRLSEMCCSAVSQLLMLGKSVISNANKVQQEDADGDIVDIDWPEDSVEKAKVMRTKARSMAGYVEAVSNSFITGRFTRLPQL